MLSKINMFGVYIGQKVYIPELKRIEELIGVTLDGKLATTFNEKTFEQSTFIIL